MIYREGGQIRTTYASDQRIFPIEIFFEGYRKAGLME
jgi:hypothetical protein